MIWKKNATKAQSIARQTTAFIKRHKVLLIVLVVAYAVLAWGPTIYANLSTRHERYDLDKTAISKIPKRPVAIVFGAGVYQDGTPTPYLQWRVENAVKFYQ